MPCCRREQTGNRGLFMEKRHGAALDGAPLVVVCSAAAELCLFLRHLLEGQGLAVEIAVATDDAIDRINRRQAAVVLVDCQLEGALELCRAAREAMDETGGRIVVLFSTNALHEYPDFLAAGIDEGLVRPVEPGAIVSAVWRKTRQSNANDVSLISFRDVEIDMRGRRVRRGGKEVRLTRIEFELLIFFAQNPMTVFSREALIAGAWPKGVFVEPRTVNIHIGRLRRRLMESGGGNLIRTVRGSGYALDETEMSRQEEKAHGDEE
ncbi:response regulator transcription factor [Rhizobium rhizophilum]|uniref:Response regulator transcription factor n=2 Tax=Rhizobium rhizophilum TaxID=1850373 RepID=A0ABY2QSL0_9HYPH|nr:response regulator transcription factor [Rhizobium rhizophilum]